MNTQELERLRDGLHGRLDNTLTAPLPPSMLALLARIKESQSEKLQKHHKRKGPSPKAK